MRRILVTIGAVILLLLIAAFTYAIYERSSAGALVDTARQIRSTEDAEREIAAWRKRSGQKFWEESDHPGGDHNYDGQIENLVISRFHIVAPAAITLGVTMRGGKLRCVTLIMQSGRCPTGSVWIQEWIDSGTAEDFHISETHRPRQAFVEFSSSMPDTQREKAFGLNLNCFVRISGCNTAEEILPNVWRLPRARRQNISLLR